MLAVPRFSSTPDRKPRILHAGRATDTNETAKAVFLNYNGCPKPDPSVMGLTGRRMPGKPFLDIGGGGCYACPNADDDGTILVTD